MNRLRVMSLLLMVVVALMLAACPRKQPVVPPGGGGSAEVQGVEITSRLTGTVVGGGPVNLTLVGTAAHVQSGLRVIFTAKQLVLRDPLDIGPLTVTLDPRHESVGSLASRTFPTTHKQNFFLQINSDKWGTLVSDAPLTLSAQIASSPPTATYESTGGAVQFYRIDDPGKTPRFTVQSVRSDVKPAVSQAVDITSRVSATAAGRQVDLTLTGRAVHLLSGRSVLFISKRLVAVNPGDVGPLTFTLNPRRSSVGTLASDSFPTVHRQSFFLQVESGKLGTLVSDDPVVVEAEIQSSPPRATYRFAGSPVAFYRQGDSDRRPVLTIERVESDVTPAERSYK